MYEESFCKRLTELRMEKGVSARDMSLSIGQNESYINRIENRKMMPSMTAFFYICDYFDITPGEFFHTEEIQSKDILDAAKKLQTMEPDKRKLILELIQKF